MPTRPPRHRPRQSQHSQATPRPSARERGYTWQWEKARAAYLAAYPLCAQCQSEGRLVAATVVDHKVPHKGNYALFWMENNLQSLCKLCHDRKTAREDGGFGHTCHSGK